MSSMMCRIAASQGALAKSWFALFASACAASPSPSGRDDLGLFVAKDLDPSADVVAVELIARTSTHDVMPDRPSSFATYSGFLPGPLIRAKRGNTLRVHFENQLEEATTIHWHGVRVPNAMDGVPEMSQSAVQPRAAFDYSFELPDAGLFWYHPHQNSVVQVGSGLYGAILVEDPDEPPDLGDEVVLVLSDASLGVDGEVLAPATDVNAVLAGNEGNVLLVNGRVYPTLPASSGRRQRWRILNAARSRYFELGLEGHSFLQIGSDGGRVETPIDVANPVLAPGERLDLLVTPKGDSGTSVDLMSLAYSRGLPLPRSQPQPLVKVEFVNDRPSSPPLSLPPSSLAPLDIGGAERVSIALTIDSERDGIRMGINGVAFGEAEPVHARVGSTQVLVVDNKSPYSHPFHLHGFFFQALAADGSPERPLAFKDTIDIPPLSRRELATRYDDRPGMWMFHCHILDHAEVGMMGMIHVMR